MRLVGRQKSVKITAGILIISVFILALLSLLGFFKDRDKKNDYGVFLGIEKTEIHKLDSYKTVVIDPSNFTKSDIDQLHKDNKLVYGYLNIGSIEKFRPYYKNYEKLTLATYENWPDECWIDVTSNDWQEFVVKNLGKKYADKGIDGFFIDNTDVYYQYPREEIFQGLTSIMKGLRDYKLKIIINGGDPFVSRCIDEKIAKDLFDGINQECVFTSIDFDNKSYGIQAKDETKRYKEYLSKVKKAGLEVYLLEYGAGPSIQDIIDEYCKQNDFKYYNAESLELK
ncbi:endo alpha-1,4 polygalactosaminidase [Peptostreptococcus stomatis]|uniref:endo alpha-1,4 polygalactosaminidase n=1 Tax=Peptostreptococcus stomatis TaxID=341694 RepID=UPI0028D0EC0B|nr:endo alpha-1,4 polygalactosaminidase [Peptostreptococcus stomatis]